MFVFYVSLDEIVEINSRSECRNDKTCEHMFDSATFVYVSYVVENPALRMFACV